MRKFIIIAALALAACNGSKTEQASEAAGQKSTVYYNGDIVTMEGDTASYAEAVAVKDGKILFVGAKDEAMKQAGEGHEMVDLQGKTMLPGFIDAHGHGFNAGFQNASANLLPPPDGNGTNIDSVVAILQRWYVDHEKAAQKVGWIIGFGYDDSQLKEKRHPNANDLDKVSNTLPVIAIHQSGHLSAVNHKALELIGYGPDTKDPAGGVIQREKDGKTPNGVLEETAGQLALLQIFSKVDSAANEVLALAGVNAYKRFGFTTIQEGASTPGIDKTWRNLAAAGKLDVDVASFPVLVISGDYLKQQGVTKDYDHHFRVAGVKITLDGSPQGRTAWLTKPYVVPPPGQPKTYRGYPSIPRNSLVDSLVEQAFANGWPVLAHCNGDAAGDQFIAAVSKAEAKLGKADRRPVMIHAQTARVDQLDSMKSLGIIPSFFSMHTYYWGDWHRDVTLGKERAAHISPAATALKKGIWFTEHHDAPVGLPSSLLVMHTAVNRVSRTGAVIGPDERLTPYQAIESITKWAAYQYFEEDRKGTLKAGKLADFVILNKNPMKIDPMKIIDLQVMETIKEGKSVYKKL